jgi:hypothetical protein
MAHLTMMDLASRSRPMAERKAWKPGGEKGKLHRELGIKEGEKIPAARLAEAEHSENPEIKRDAIRAKTMEGWKHGGRKAAAKAIYTHPRSRPHG